MHYGEVGGCQGNGAHGPLPSRSPIYRWRVNIPTLKQKMNSAKERQQRGGQDECPHHLGCIRGDQFGTWLAFNLDPNSIQNKRQGPRQHSGPNHSGRSARVFYRKADKERAPDQKSGNSLQHVWTPSDKTFQGSA